MRIATQSQALLMRDVVPHLYSGMACTNLMKV